MLSFIKDLSWRDVRAALESSPELFSVRDERGRSWLHVCCGVNAAARKLAPADGVRTARVLLDAGFDVNEPAFREGEWRATPLWYAIGRGQNLRLAKLLLERGSTPEYCLFAACYQNDFDAIRLLVRSGAPLEEVAERETPFLGAIKGSRFGPAELLLELGANVDFQDDDSMTALHYMLKKRSEKKHFQMIIKHGARGDIENADGVTAAEIMRKKKDPDYRKMADELFG